MVVVAWGRLVLAGTERVMYGLFASVSVRVLVQPLDLLRGRRTPLLSEVGAFSVSHGGSTGCSAPARSGRRTPTGGRRRR